MRRERIRGRGVLLARVAVAGACSWRHWIERRLEDSGACLDGVCRRMGYKIGIPMRRVSVPGGVRRRWV